MRLGRLSPAPLWIGKKGCQWGISHCYPQDVDVIFLAITGELKNYTGVIHSVVHGLFTSIWGFSTTLFTDLSTGVQMNTSRPGRVVTGGVVRLLY